jgi:hypothetical protein
VSPAQSPSPIAYAEETVVPAATRTASGDTGVLAGYGGASSLRVQLLVTGAAGTAPTLDVVIEDTLDGVEWNTVGSFAQKTGVGREVINVTSPFANRLRVRWTVGGTTPSFTFAVVVVSQSPLS